MEHLEKYKEEFITFIISYLPKLAGAILLLAAGFYIIGHLTRYLKKLMLKREMDATLVPFLSAVINILLKVLLIISVAAMLGIQTTSFVAMLGAAGLAVGLALQGSLSNFAGGILIILFRPYRVGDFIEVQGKEGTVHSIQILYTILKSPENITLIIPNSSIMSGSIANYSTEETRRLDLVFRVGYNEDIQKVKELLTQLAMDNERILQEPNKPFIAVNEMADSSIDFLFRVWVKQGDYLSVKFELQEKVKVAFDLAGVTIPLPRREVLLYQQR